MAKVSKREWTYKGEKKTAWIVRYFDQSGARRQETFEKKKDADACRLRIENQLRNGTHVAMSQTCTVADLGRLFLEDCERRQKIKDRMTRTTLRNYYILVEQHVVAQFGAKLLTDLSYDDAQNWLNESCTSMTRHTVVARYKMLSVMLKFAVRKKLVGRNVIVEGGVRVPDAERRRISIPSLADLKAVLVALDDRAPHERRHCFVNRRAVVGLALFNGLRRGEIAGLRWENVDLAAGTFSVKHSRSFYDGLKSPKTFAGNREQVFVPYVAEALRQLHEMQGRPSEGYVVLNQRGKPICVGSLYVLWSNLARKAGFSDADGRPRWRFHDFRHAAASLLISEGVTPLHVAAFMGHSSVNTTLGVYGHLFPEDTRVAKAFTEIAGRMLPAARLTHEPVTH